MCVCRSLVMHRDKTQSSKTRFGYPGMGKAAVIEEGMHRAFVIRGTFASIGQLGGVVGSDC